ncbi:Protease HtpX [Methanosarcinales archaeon]|nr:Protease HtpX [Methanosarcinales archaeon]
MSIFNKILFFIILIIIPSVSGIIYGLVGLFVALFISLWICFLLVIINADKFLLGLYKARHAPSGELSDIRNKILMLSKKHGVSAPSIYISDLELPGSFIIGRNVKKTSIVIPKRLFTLLKSDEFEAVLAHNIVQVDNTIRKRTSVALIAGAMTMYAYAIRWGAVFTGFGDINDPAPKLVGLFTIGLAAPPAATLIHSLPEDHYDAKAVTLLGNSGSLISAISHLESNNVTGYPSLGFICLIDPQKENFFESLFDVHPLRDTRIKKLTAKGEKK